MSLAHGRPYLAIPGPSVMPDAVLRAMHRASPNIYEGELVDMVAGMIPDLRYVAQTEGHVAIYISNGHGAWEAALSNVLAEGDKVLVPATGRFGHGWADMAQGLGIELGCRIICQQLMKPLKFFRGNSAMTGCRHRLVKFNRWVFHGPASSRCWRSTHSCSRFRIRCRLL